MMAVSVLVVLFSTTSRSLSLSRSLTFQFMDIMSSGLRIGLKVESPKRH